MKHIFVFGSNLAGIHGAGSALHAKRFYGAKQGIGVGPWGDSYAIPTKDERLHTLAKDSIKDFVKDFLEYAARHPEMQFHCVAIGCGLAGYTAKDIAPMFKNHSENVILPIDWYMINECQNN